MIKKLSTLVGEAQNLLTDLGQRADREVKHLASVRVGAEAQDAGNRKRPAPTRKKMESRRKNREDAS